MANNRVLKVGPVALSATLTTNILNPAAAGSGTGYTPTASYIILRHIRILNKRSDGASATVSLWIGATGANAAGTEFAFSATPVAANQYVDWFGSLRLDAADFLVGGASTATSLVFIAEGEVGLA